MSDPRRYHHGNLRQRLLEVALELAQEVGPDRLSLREVARRLGVAPSAPYRHFPSRRALLTAVAEEATARLNIGMVQGAAAHRGEGLVQLQAIGEAYLDWAQHNAMHFRVVSARDQIDYAASPGMAARNEELRRLTVQALQTAQRKGQSGPHDPEALAVLARATVYGLARMQQDGHFAQWGVAADEGWATARQLLGLFVSLIGHGQVDPADIAIHAAPEPR